MQQTNFKSLYQINYCRTHYKGNVIDKEHELFFTTASVFVSVLKNFFKTEKNKKYCTYLHTLQVIR